MAGVGRRALGLSVRRQVSPYQTVVNQKCDNRFPTASVIVALAEELDCSIDWLLTGSERQFSEELNNVKEKVRSAVEILQKIN